MYSPTTRVLTVLEILQSRGSITGPELAEKLEVDVRSVRRYVTMLRDMGIPVESERGRYGTYSIRPGYRMPPLVFNDDEVLSIVLGLRVVEQMGLVGTFGIESATAKIARVLPDKLRQRVDAVHDTLTFDLPKSNALASETLGLFSTAAHQHRRLHIGYETGMGNRSERDIDVYGMVFHGGLWYAVGYCHLRGDLRNFRLDRVWSAHLLDEVYAPPEHFNVLDYLLNAIATIPGTWEALILLKLDMAEARERVSPSLALLEPHPDGTLMRLYTVDLNWLARYLVRLGCEFVVIQPDGLRDALRRLAAQVASLAEAVDVET
jgi:predicted DNA-binding transcriptional regulator YafY